MDNPTSPADVSSTPPTTRRGAVGKALLVWLVSGSFGLAVLAFVAFKVMGC